MPVGQMLESMTSLEITEWQAYEKALGPLGRQYDHEQLAKLNENIQLLTYITARAASGDKGADELEKLEPKSVPRPPEFFLTADQNEETSNPAQPVLGAADLSRALAKRQATK